MRINAPIRQNVCVAVLRSTAVTLCLVGSSAWAQSAGSDNKPYDERLVRLSEILGSTHYLRELCGANDGQYWRLRMQELVDAEGSSARRGAQFARSFNAGYNNYSRTYSSCTPSAQQAIAKLLTEGAEIAETLVKTIP